MENRLEKRLTQKKGERREDERGRRGETESVRARIQPTALGNMFSITLLLKLMRDLYCL